MGLRAKLILTVVTVTGAVFFLAGLLVVDESRARLREVMSSRGEALLAAMAQPCAISMSQGHFEVLDNYVAEVSHSRHAEDTELEYLMVLDHEGRVVAHTDPTRFGEKPERSLLLEKEGALALPGRRVVTRGEREFLEISVPIESGLRWGSLVASFSLDELNAEMDAETWRLAAAAAALALVMGLALYFLLTSHVLRRLRGLLSATSAMGKGDLAQRVEVHGHDEIARLGLAFNDMAEQLQTYTRNLESAVEERSTELTTANKRLKTLNADLSEAVEQLGRLAITDGLTGLFNHRHFHESLALEVKRSERAGHPVSVIMIDVDHFKDYNDRNGHPQGDAVLERLASIFRESLRGVDLVARYGGEEFSVLLLDTDTRGACVVAEKIRASVAAALFHNQEAQPSGNLTVSLGVASFPAHGATPDQVLRAADRALYKAKAEGRNRVVSAEILHGR